MLSCRVSPLLANPLTLESRRLYQRNDEEELTAPLSTSIEFANLAPSQRQRTAEGRYHHEPTAGMTTTSDEDEDGKNDEKENKGNASVEGVKNVEGSEGGEGDAAGSGLERGFNSVAERLDAFARTSQSSLSTLLEKMERLNDHIHQSYEVKQPGERHDVQGGVD